MEKLPAAVREFAEYLTGLVGRLDQGSGWCGVFWRRDPDGMQACLEGREEPPWDVVEALLQDLAALHGQPYAVQEAARARELHAASLAAYDALPGARDRLGSRLDVMLREQRHAAGRRAELARQLPTAPPDEAAAVERDLAWAQDDHARASARCTELQARLAEIDRRTGAGPDPHLGARPDPAAGYGGSDPGTGYAGFDHDDTRQRDADPTATGHTSFDHGRARQSGFDPAGEQRADCAPAGRDLADDAPTGTGRLAYDPMGAGQVGFDPVDAGRADYDPMGAERADYDPVNAGQVDYDSVGEGSADYGPTGAGQVDYGPTGAGRVDYDTMGAGQADYAPSGLREAGFAPAAGQVDHDGAAMGRSAHDPGDSASAYSEAPDHSGAEPGPRGGGRADRPRGARFAGAGGAGSGEQQAAVLPGVFRAAPAAGTPRGARFAGSPGAPSDDPQQTEADEAARQAVAGAVAALMRLRAEGRGGEAHAVLVEAAYWPPDHFPLLAVELGRVGLDPDWSTLLWEAASQPTDRLIALADTLTSGGLAADGSRLLRQAVARPAPEVSEAALALVEEGRDREVGALLDACVRSRSPEEAARCAQADPQRLVPLLTAAAEAVSDACHSDLLHALRVAGFAR